jgi:WD40 repeat protein
VSAPHTHPQDPPPSTGRPPISPADGAEAGGASAPAADNGNQAPTLGPPSAPSEPPAADAPTLAPSAPAAEGPEAEQPVIPGYEVLGVLGRGGMGVVYQARQVGLNRLVALKMILAGAHAGPEDLERFRREAEAAARLQHPNIVQIHEVGAHHGLPFFSLEYVHGGSLAQRLHGTPLPARQAAQLVARLAHTMHAAHQQQIVHRDLKPANVLLQEGPDVPLGDCTPKITDFGLAKQLDSQHGQTRSGAILGTPSYMAPEQAGGKKEIGPAADVYALGAILYECLTGRPPFRAETPLDTVLQVLSDEPVPPGRLVPKLPRDVETICLKCLQKEPAKRYGGADRLADDLEAYLDGRPIAARPVGRVERAWRWCRRNQALAAAVVAVTLALVAGSVVSTAFGLRANVNAEQARRAQVEEARQRAAAEDLARSNRRQLIDLLVSNGNRLLGESDPGAALPWLAEAARLDPDEPAHAGRLDGALALLPRPVYFWRHEPAVNHLAVSPDGRRAVTGSNDGTTRVWDLETGAPTGAPLKLGGAVMAVAFSPDGKRVAAAGGVIGFNGEVRVWDAATGAAVSQPIRLPGLALFAGFSDDGTRLVTTELTMPGLLLGRTEDPKVTFRAHEVATGKPLGQVVADLWQKPTVATIEMRVHGGTGRALRVKGERATIVDVAGSRPVGEPLVHRRPIRFARLSPDGGRAITIDTDGAAKVREVATGKEWDLTLGYGGDPLDAGFTVRGEVAVAFADGAVQRYRLADGQAVPNSVYRLGAEGWRSRFDADAVFLTGLDQEGTARVWDVEDGRPVSPALRHGAVPTGSVLTTGGRRLLVGADDGSVRLWDLALASADVPRATLSYGAFRPERVDFDAAGRCLVLGEGRVLRFDAAAVSGDRTSAEPADRSVQTTVLSPDGSRLAVCTSQGEARLLDATTGKALLPPLKHGRPFVLDAVLSPDGLRLGTRAAAGTERVAQFLADAHLWDLSTGKEVMPPLRPGSLLEPGVVSCLALSPDGRWFAVGSGRVTLGGFRGEVRLYEAATGKSVGRPLLTSTGQGPFRLAFSPDGRRLAVLAGSSLYASSELALWDVEAAELAMPPARLNSTSRDCAFDPPGRRLAVTAGTALQVWDPAAGKLVHVLPHRGEVTAVRYQREGRVLLSIAEAGTSHEVYLWDAATGEALRPPVRHPEPVKSAALSPDGRFLATAADRLVRVWDLAADPGRGEERSRLARLLSCQDVDGTTAVPVPVARLAADWEYLRHATPDQFTPTGTQVRQWEGQQASPLKASRLIAAEAWTAAVRQYELLLAQQPDNHWWRYEAFSCCLAAGDREGRRRYAEAMLRFNADTLTLLDIERTVKSCLLLPDTLPDPAPAIQLAERLEKVNPTDPYYAWLVVTRGIALYRAGSPDEAAAWLGKARTKPVLCGILADLFLAMIRARQSRTDDARKLLADAGRALDAADKEPGRFTWLDRVHCHAVLREAKKTVGVP